MSHGTPHGADPSARPNTPSGPSPGETGLRSLVQAFGLIQRIMLPYFTSFGLSAAKWGILRALQRAEGEGLEELRLTDVSSRMLIQPPGVTAVVARLRNEGLVRIRLSPADRRSRLVSLTPRGRRLVERVLVGHPERVQRLVSGLSEPEQAEFARLVGRLNEGLRRLADAESDARPRGRRKRGEGTLG